MAVHKRAYRPYDGPLTSERCAFPGPAPLRPPGAVRIAPAHGVLRPVLRAHPHLGLGHLPGQQRAAARALLEMSSDADFVRKPDFFFAILTFQGSLAFLLTAWVAPVLVSPDLVNGALPLYLSRPFTRVEYVLGKATVLVTLLSAHHLGSGPRPLRAAGGTGRRAGWRPTSASPPPCSRGRGCGSSCSRSWASPSPRGSDGGWWPAAPSPASSSWGRPSGRCGGRSCAGHGDAWRTCRYLVGLVWRSLFGLFTSRSMAAGDVQRARP